MEAPDEPETPAILPVGDASRVLPTGRVAQGTEFAVTINGVGLAEGIGQIEETLDSGLTYVDGSAASTTPNAAIDDGDAVTGVITFSLVAVDSFTYKVTVGADVADGPYAFSGLLKKLSGEPTTIAGDPSVTVGTPAPVRRPRARAQPSNRAPSFEEGASATRSVAENSAAGTAVGDPITATDREDDDIAYSLVSGDTELFDINKSNGQLSVAEGANLDFESKSTYSVTARAMDDGGRLDNITVSIRVTDVDEAGMIDVSAEAPELGSELMAAVMDPDGDVTSISWQWERSEDQMTWTSIEGATSASYTPETADEGQYLRADRCLHRQERRQQDGGDGVRQPSAGGSCSYARADASARHLHPRRSRHPRPLRPTRYRRLRLLRLHRYRRPDTGTADSDSRPAAAA